MSLILDPERLPLFGDNLAVWQWWGQLPLFAGLHICQRIIAFYLDNTGIGMIAQVDKQSGIIRLQMTPQNDMGVLDHGAGIVIHFLEADFIFPVHFVNAATAEAVVRMIFQQCFPLGFQFFLISGLEAQHFLPGNQLFQLAGKSPFQLPVLLLQAPLTRNSSGNTYQGPMLSLPAWTSFLIRLAFSGRICR
jgi:hypothetical protein